MATTSKTQTALEAYETRTAAIKKLLAQINEGLLEHDRKASQDGGHNWATVGDLAYVQEELAEIKAFLYNEDEPVKPTYSAYNSDGKKIRVTIPE